jgi:hypothetical protein
MALSPARPLDWNSIQTFLADEMVHCLRDTPEFVNASHTRDQCYYACQALRTNHNPPVPYSLIARLLGVTKGTILWHVKQYTAHGEEEFRPGRPPLLSLPLRDQLVEFIQRRYDDRKPCTMPQILDYIMEISGTSLDRDTARMMLKRDGRVKPCKGMPIEEKRLEVSGEQLLGHFQRMFDMVEGVPAHFVLNMDEMGHQEWADRQVKLCYVPLAHSEKQVYVPVSRLGKRITLVACVAADGSFMKPFVIIPRKTVDADLPLTGMTQEKLTVHSQPKGFITTEIFEAWFDEIFVPELNARRSRQEYNGRAVLMLDGCTAHSSPRVNQLCEANNVKLFPLPPHSSNQLQALDLSLFGVTKRLMARVNRMETVNVQSKHIAQVVCAFLSAATPLNIVASFRNAGIGLVVDQDMVRCQVQPNSARCLLHPLEPPGVEIPDEDAGADMEAELYIRECMDLIIGPDESEPE